MRAGTTTVGVGLIIIVATTVGAATGTGIEIGATISGAIAIGGRRARDIQDRGGGGRANVISFINFELKVYESSSEGVRNNSGST